MFQFSSASTQGELEAFDFGREPAFDPSLLDLAHGDGGDAAARARDWAAAARDAYNGDVARACRFPEGPLRNEACGKVKRDHQAKFLEAWSPVDRERAALHLYAAAHDKFRETPDRGWKFAFEIAAPELLRAKRAPPRGP